MNEYKLTNLDISSNYQSRGFYLFKQDFTAVFAYWVIKQSPYDIPDMSDALCAFDEYIEGWANNRLPNLFTYQQLENIINANEFEKIPEIEKLNHRKNGRDGMGFCSRFDKPEPDDDFIDLGALARNVFYMVMREQIKDGD